MSTTNLFVELIVIGVGVAAWLMLLLGAVFGYAWLPADTAVLLSTAVPALAVTYVFGIIWDRIADSVFERLWSDDLRAAYFADRAAYYNARRIILTNSEALSELMEYGRSRLRICRGWSLNAVMIGLSLNILTWTRFAALERAWLLSLAGTVVCAAVAAGSWFAWKSLAKAEYRKIREQSAFLSVAAAAQG